MTNKSRHGLLTRFAARLTFTASALLCLLVLFSWIVNAADTGLNVRSMLSSEGIRWFFGTFARNIASVPLAWAVLLAVGGGAMNASGMIKALRSLLHEKPLAYRSRAALLATAGAALFMCAVLCLMTLVPHAVLLGVTGTLFPGPFSESLIPAIAFMMTAMAVIYGLQSGSMSTIDDVLVALSHGPRTLAPLVPPYIVCMTLLRSIYFVWGNGA